MAGAQYPFLNGHELLADDVPLLFRVAHALKRAEKFALGLLHMKRGGSQLLEQAADVGGLAVAHQSGIHIDTVDAIGSQGTQAERVGDGGIHTAADKKEHVAIARDRSDLFFERADAILRIPILLTPANAENKIRKNSEPFGGMHNFGMKLHRE